MKAGCFLETPMYFLSGIVLVLVVREYSIYYPTTNYVESPGCRGHIASTCDGLQ